ncbi:hypothetical protein ElyMa_006003000 [Elysia marginata]|uniref:Uncharacterized protein n=1 Tax=Elysia marginata TaxID=1093978 RepID=A0AAV4GHE8_9GAST|nr:hypothetical protein ElyMa_006003000 [Elysia marginata]
MTNFASKKTVILLVCMLVAASSAFKFPFSGVMTEENDKEARVLSEKTREVSSGSVVVECVDSASSSAISGNSGIDIPASGESGDSWGRDFDVSHDWAWHHNVNSGTGRTVGVSPWLSYLVCLLSVYFANFIISKL